MHPAHTEEERGSCVPVAGGQLPLTRPQAQWQARWAPGAAASHVPPVDAFDSPLLNFMAVRAILAAPDGLWPEDTHRYREVRTEADARLIVNADALSRAFRETQR